MKIQVKRHTRLGRPVRMHLRRKTHFAVDRKQLIRIAADEGYVGEKAEKYADYMEKRFGDKLDVDNARWHAGQFLHGTGTKSKEHAIGEERMLITPSLNPFFERSQTKHEGAPKSILGTGKFVIAGKPRGEASLLEKIRPAKIKSVEFGTFLPGTPEERRADREAKEAIQRTFSELQKEKVELERVARAAKLQLGKRNVESEIPEYEEELKKDKYGLVIRKKKEDHWRMAKGRN